MPNQVELRLNACVTRGRLSQIVRAASARARFPVARANSDENGLRVARAEGVEVKFLDVRARVN